jgi:hypothetical protein
MIEVLVTILLSLFLVFLMIASLFIYCSDDIQSDIKIWFAVISIFIIICYICLSYAVEDQQDKETWNGGYCPNCNIEWTLINVQQYKGEYDYYWTCENCNKVIELHTNFFD